MECVLCTKKAIIKRSKTKAPMCESCFYTNFEDEIHNLIIKNNLFKPGENIGVCISGGKDSTVLAHVMTALNSKYHYNIKLHLIAIDEGIKGYRDDSLKTVAQNKEEYGLPLTVLSYQDLYKGWTMDNVVKLIGTKNNCTYCGVFRRQALDRAAQKLGISHILTGHNADDIAETVVMNVLRGDIGRLQRCVNISTSDEASSQIKRSKPFKYTYEKEIVMYAYLKKLNYFSTECTYAKYSYRANARTYIKDLESADPIAILNIISSGEKLSVKEDVKTPILTNCEKCGYISSNKKCKACSMLESLDNLELKEINNKSSKYLSTRVITQKNMDQINNW